MTVCPSIHPFHSLSLSPTPPPHCPPLSPSCHSSTISHCFTQPASHSGCMRLCQVARLRRCRWRGGCRERRLLGKQFTGVEESRSFTHGLEGPHSVRVRGSVILSRGPPESMGMCRDLLICVSITENLSLLFPACRPLSTVLFMCLCSI